MSFSGKWLLIGAIIGAAFGYYTGQKAP